MRQACEDCGARDGARHHDECPQAIVAARWAAAATAVRDARSLHPADCDCLACKHADARPTLAALDAAYAPAAPTVVPPPEGRCTGCGRPLLALDGEGPCEWCRGTVPRG